MTIANSQGFSLLIQRQEWIELIDALGLIHFVGSQKKINFFHKKHFCYRNEYYLFVVYKIKILL